ncbi:flagellar protein FliT [Paraburkholderia bonniea]|uniref:flagellar protein FliT n=1 Tax=Paraburkholderia bonniea TaxID=2152891 RepID=UPI001580AE66|nr:flagellar protein FliT [Paraburkholderia bonniea]WJF90397.1 flagellar protein FliT [Paraburkholderia bonniea]WJF93712.1 flagellar protein FliT [Paraburkholderia bonniea]
MVPESLTQAFTLTQAIEAAATRSDWVKAAALVETRAPLLKSLQPPQPPEALDIIRAIQRIDSAVAIHAQAEKDAMAVRQSHAMQQIESVSLYQTTGML